MKRLAKRNSSLFVECDEKRGVSLAQSMHGNWNEVCYKKRKFISINLKRRAKNRYFFSSMSQRQSECFYRLLKIEFLIDCSCAYLPYFVMFDGQSTSWLKHIQNERKFDRSGNNWKNTYFVFSFVFHVLFVIVNAIYCDQIGFSYIFVFASWHR